MKKIKKAIAFLANPRLLLCLGMAWMVTNGWSYVLFSVGMFLEIEWMAALASAYLAFLWLPVSPEKLATAAIAIALLRRLFPDDQRTLGVLREFHANVKKRLQK